jgi:hypothetical protein
MESVPWWTCFLCPSVVAVMVIPLPTLLGWGPILAIVMKEYVFSIGPQISLLQALLEDIVYLMLSKDLLLD